MKKLLFTTALCTSGLIHAATPIDGWYSSLFGGYAYVPNNLNMTRHNLTRNDAEYRNGYDAGGSIGFKSTPLRYEGEITYINTELEHFKINGITQTGIKGHNQVLLGMANVYFDFPNFQRCLEPYLGVGLGYGYVDGFFKGTGPSLFSRFEASESVVAYQGMAGITYNFAETYSLNIGYRYVATEKVDHFGKLFQAHLANIGVVYRFDGSHYK